MQDKKNESESYNFVSVPQSEWPNIHKWFGNRVSMTSLVLTELSKIKKTKQNGQRKALDLGVRTIDAMVGGLFNGEILYLGNETENGNFAFCLNIIKRLAVDNDKKVLVFNCGRGEYEYARGLLSLCAEVDVAKLKNPEQLSDAELQRLDEAAEKIRLADLSIVNTPNLCVEHLCDEAKKVQDEECPDVILIDNLRFLTSTEACDDRQAEYGVIAQKLWQLAKDSGIPIVLTGPLSKQRRTMSDYWPTACDMPAENILDSFDKIVMVHPCREPCETDIFNVTVVKNPEGTYGYRQIELLPEYNKLTEMIEQGEC